MYLWIKNYRFKNISFKENSLWWLIENFSDFWRNNRVFIREKKQSKQKKKTFKKYLAQGKFMLWQLVSKFADLRLNCIYAKRNCTFKKYFPQGKFIFQKLVAKNSEFLPIFNKMIMHLYKKKNHVFFLVFRSKKSSYLDN